MQVRCITRIINKMSATKSTILEYAISELNGIMDSWCNTYDSGCTGGKMRGARGCGVEDFAIKVIDRVASELKINLIAKKGETDKKKLSFPEDNTVSKDHQVDIHIYLNDTFIAVIECKAYLDSCYYVRACNDFELFKRFGYDIKSVVLSLENCISENDKKFTDYAKQNVCDGVFYILDGKRSSNKPIYQSKYRKPVNQEKLMKFIDFIYDIIG